MPDWKQAAEEAWDSPSWTEAAEKHRATHPIGLNGGGNLDPDPQRPPPLNAERLVIMQFDPIKFIVPDVLVEGLTLFAGKPKVGKSWLLLHAAMAVARGGFTLGTIHCPEGDVLYCGLEDPLRRLKSRMEHLMQGSPIPKRLWFQTEMPRLNDGGLHDLKLWLKDVPHPRLIIIDTLAMIRSISSIKSKETQYATDYASVQELRALAIEHKICIVIVHHLRKAEADEPLDSVSGTLGLTGAVDSVLVLKRETGNAGDHICLYGKGRDLPDVEKAVTFNRDSCIWAITGDAREVKLSNERQTILKCLRDSRDPMSPHEITSETGMRSANIRKLLKKMINNNEIEKVERGKYRISIVTTHEQCDPVLD